jgi:hypothetical protein
MMVKQLIPNDEETGIKLANLHSSKKWHHEVTFFSVNMFVRFLFNSSSAGLVSI